MADLTKADGVVAREAHGQTVLLRLRDGEYFTLDEVGVEVWRLCDGTRDVNGVVAGVLAAFDGPAEEVRRDVIAFVGELVDEGLLSRGA